jgi:hypothetical protein
MVLIRPIDKYVGKCAFKVIHDKNGRICYFQDGIRVCEAVGQARLQLINEYLGPTSMVQEFLLDGRDRFDLCRLGLPDLQFTEVRPDQFTDAHSTSVVANAVVHDMNVVVKLSFAQRSGQGVDIVAIERLLYTEFVPYMSRFTPNLLSFLGNGHCRTFQTSLASLVTNQTSFAKEIQTVVQKIYSRNKNSERFNFNDVTLMVTRRAGGKSLLEWLWSGGQWRTWDVADQRKFMSDVLFQIGYTLSVFEDLGLMHNDLHCGNVFVEQLSMPLSLSYGIDDDCVVSENVSFFVRIFDFGLANKTPTQYEPSRLVNTLLNTDGRCRAFGTCDTFRNNADWFMILQHIYRTSDNYWIIEEIANKELLRFPVQNDPGISSVGARLAWAGHACMCESSVCTECTKIVLDGPEYDYMDQQHNFPMKSPEQFLKKFYVHSECRPEYVRPRLFPLLPLDSM